MNLPFSSFVQVLTLFIFCLTSTLAQAQKLNGYIKNDNNEAIIDAYLWINDGALHSHSNEIGHFTINNVHVNDTLHINYFGSKSIIHTITQDDLDSPQTWTMSTSFFELDQVFITNDLTTVNKVANIDIATTPVRSSQEVLRRVPGLFIGQHAGGGKAEQIFLRGFDIDHGTDIAINVDGMPVNMVSHAHGQGYADLHFLIPETIEKIDFGKGPYYAAQGNFNTAGYVNFKTKNSLDNNQVGFEVGDFNTLRSFAAINLLDRLENHDAYVATEFLYGDGPFESPQNFRRMNIMGKYTFSLDRGEQFSVLLSRFYSKWDASGQIPQRAIDRGDISRFGSIDDTEGGTTSRTNIALEYTKPLAGNTFIKTNAYYSAYDFELFSNFTFFLDDPINGDQIQQLENRSIYGLSSTLFQSAEVFGLDTETQFGIGFRYDDVDNNQLSHTVNRSEILERYAFGDVDELNTFAFANADIELGDFMINTGVRLDYFNFSYQDRLATAYTSLSESKATISPKFNILYNPTQQWQFFLKNGVGFHSNDTRVVVAQSANEILPKAYGSDLGFVYKPKSRIWINAALWYLFLEQEFVYVGDAGIVEPSGRTERKGIDLGIRYQLTNNLFLDTDLTYTSAISIDEQEGSNRIPLAPVFTSAGGVTYKGQRGIFGSLRYRYLTDRPANEDNSIIAEGYFITDFNIGYNFDRLSLGVTVENVFDQEWNEAQFATESRLASEPASVEELHFTPGTPFFVKANARYRF